MKKDYTPGYMVQEVMITVLPGEENNPLLVREKICQELSRNGIHVSGDRISALVFRKKSIDARRGRIRIHLKYTVYIDGPPSPEEIPSGGDGSVFVPAWKKCDPGKKVVIVGSGPAGLFAALRLIEDGITPVIVERGPPASDRKQDIAAISTRQTVNPDSNYCFGEGGAGTFSDGKVYSRSNKRGNIDRILRIFHWHGADSSILTDAHPHIGTDRLPGIISRIRETICSYGGEIHFNARCTGLIYRNGRIAGIKALRGPEESAELHGDAVILAAGHSARDIYEMLADFEKGNGISGRILEAKAFAAGVRVEHPRAVIDRIQYHGLKEANELPAAEYRLSAQIDGRGVYSFCMCPGGFIIPSATHDDEIVVNGMSSAGRNSRWSNSAIVVEIRPEDVPGEFSDHGSPALAGIRFQHWIEHEAKKQGEGQKAPAQRLVDFMDARATADFPEYSYTPGLISSRLDLWLPKHIASRLREAFTDYNMKMKGFISPEAVLVAPETRTSSPVRILRNSQTLESESLPGLYPAGEGSGYAGGIVSSAMDGEKTAGAIALNVFSGRA
ncbi:FAD-binding protein [Brucepastera parasyntrophica]|uniref:NAD(P)/FAD-dependent oxidoreductase n=1 Tax=Brucepastera parasyntrophica TaxID=2880008 RepID=UPI00210EACB6|nr:FAD-binding protein [Brucepastera parasyntrophica]ULQ58765.1 FAD-binding protein [Brucepastera parasyntrophica]